MNMGYFFKVFVYFLSWIIIFVWKTTNITSKCTWTSWERVVKCRDIFYVRIGALEFHLTAFFTPCELNKYWYIFFQKRLSVCQGSFFVVSLLFIFSGLVAFKASKILQWQLQGWILLSPLPTSQGTTKMTLKGAPGEAPRFLKTSMPRLICPYTSIWLSIWGLNKYVLKVLKVQFKSRA